MAIFTFGNDRVLLEKTQENLAQIAQAVKQNNVQAPQLLEPPVISEEEKLKAAYALNLCTVSVSQIVDYDDLWVLEQEYETILNNLNIENMPKDDALLDILKHLLDTITYFRLQEGDKAMLEREYQHNLKNAIWSAVPSFNVIMGGTPLAIAASLASQVGTGYMNYRKTKADLLLTKEKNEWQLQRSAMEQFNGLRRELFETAWRLADAYQFPDEYRLTERQITQYNQILLDSDPLRRYERLLYIEPKFKAYPPFHYYLGHAANEASEYFGDSSDVRLSYRQKAKRHFEYLLESTQQNILREDQILAACILEYVELYLKENGTLTADDKSKLVSLLQKACKCAGNANDVLQLCALSYISIDSWDNAADLLRMLINEGYNQIVNAQFLSAHYVSSLLLSFDDKIETDYTTLSKRIPPYHLLQMPKVEPGKNHHDLIQDTMDGFLSTQKVLLFKKYRSAIVTLATHYTEMYNKVLYKSLFLESCADFCFTDSPEGIRAQQNSIDRFPSENSIIFPPDDDAVMAGQLLSILDCCYSDMCTLIKANDSAQKDIYATILKKLSAPDSTMTKLLSQNITKANFEKLTFNHFMADAFVQLLTHTAATIESYESMVHITVGEIVLMDYYKSCGLPFPQENIDADYTSTPSNRPTIALDILGDNAKEQLKRVEMYKKMSENIPQIDSLLAARAKNVQLYRADTSEFITYFDKHKKDLKNYRHDTLLVINNTLPPDMDWLVTSRGIYIYAHSFAQAAIQTATSKSTIITSAISLPLGLTLGALNFAKAALPKEVSPLIPYNKITLSEENQFITDETPLELHKLDINPNTLNEMIHKLSDIHEEYYPQNCNPISNESLSARLMKISTSLLNV